MSPTNKVSLKPFFISRERIRFLYRILVQLFNIIYIKRCAKIARRA